MLMEAQDAGADQGIWLDADGNVGEGPNMNVAFVSAEGVLLVPPFDNILAGTTVQRVVELATPRVAAGLVPGVREVRVGHVALAVALGAVEMMLIGSGTRCGGAAGEKVAWGFRFCRSSRRAPPCPLHSALTPPFFPCHSCPRRASDVGQRHARDRVGWEAGRVRRRGARCHCAEGAARG